MRNRHLKKRHFLCLCVGLLLAALLAIVILRKAIIKKGIDSVIVPSKSSKLQIEVVSSEFYKTVFSCHGQVLVDSYALTLALDNISVEHSLNSVLNLKSSRILINGGQIEVRKIGDSEAKTKPNNKGALLSLAHFVVPFRLLEISDVRLELTDFKDASSNQIFIDANIDPQNLSLIGMDNEKKRLFDLKIQRLENNKKLKMEASIFKSGIPLIARLSTPNYITLKNEGEIFLNGKMNLAENELNAESQLQIEVKMQKISGSLGEFEISNLNLSATINGLESPEIEKGWFSVSKISHVIAGEDLQGRFFGKLSPIAQEKLRAEDLSIKIFGGTARIKQASLALKRDWKTELLFSNIDLAKLLAVYPQSIVTATGTIDAVLPIEHGAEGLLIQQGKAWATSPGAIKLSGASATGVSSEFLSLLKNFLYDKLDADITYNPDGNLSLILHLSGKNPDWQKGQAVNFNITVSENVPALIESLKLAMGKDSGVVEKYLAR